MSASQRRPGRLRTYLREVATATAKLLRPGSAAGARRRDGRRSADCDVIIERRGDEVVVRPLARPKPGPPAGAPPR